MPVASPPKPAAAAPASSSSTAPASVNADFMSMLGRMAGVTAPTPASTAMQAGLPVLQESEELETDAEPTDTLGVMPLSLPVMPTDAPAQGTAQAAAMLGVTAGVGKAQGDAVAREAQLLTDLIQPEQLSGEGKFEIPELPKTSESASPLRQAEAAQSRPVQVPVGHAEWADEIGSRMTMMVEQGKHTASLRLSPEHLGPLEVRITMNGDQASVQFGAQHVDTRNAIENALPRLREMFASQGLSLADANVSREPPRQHTNQGSQSSPGSADFASEEGATAVSAAQVRLGLLDAYA